MASFVLLVWANRLWQFGTLQPWIVPIAVGLAILSLGVAVAAGILRRYNGLWNLLIMVGVGVGLFSWTFALIHAGGYMYGTDEIAFDQYAAHLLIHGIDPYTRSLAGSLSRYRVPPSYFTYTYSGTPITHLSYPALAFLLYIPALLLGAHYPIAAYIDVGFWFASGVVAWILWPREWRWTIPIWLSWMLFDAFVTGGVTDALFLPFLLVALWRWDRFGQPDERSIARWVGPIALGLAMAVKQTPWFFAPFLVIGSALESLRTEHRWWKRPVQYLGVTLAVFLGVNVPFILWKPGAWIHGVLLPLLAPTIPQGQGIIGLWLYHDGGNGHVIWLTVTALIVLLIMLVALIGWYPQVKRIWPAFVPLLFVFPDRSLFEYFIDTLPVTITAWVTVRDIEVYPLISRIPAGTRRTVVGGLGLLFVSLLTLGFVGHQSFQVAILNLHTTGELGLVDELRVRVINETQQRMAPHLTVMDGWGGQVTTFWIAEGPRSVGPHQSAQYTLLAPNFSSMPSINSGFAVDVFTAQPKTVSETPPFTFSGLGVQLSPQAVNSPVAVGHPVKFSVQLVNRVGQPVAMQGISVAVTQVTYGQNRLYPGDSEIDGEAPGTLGIPLTTNAHGQVSFEVVGPVSATKRPVYYQAYVILQGIPQGFSNIVVVHYTPK